MASHRHAGEGDERSMYLSAIASARHRIFADNEEPRDILISVELKYAIHQEARPYVGYRFELAGETLMGMKIEWTNPVPLAQPKILIRTTKGDTRIVNMIEAERAPPSA